MKKLLLLLYCCLYLQAACPAQGIWQEFSPFNQMQGYKKTFPVNIPEPIQSRNFEDFFCIDVATANHLNTSFIQCRGSIDPITGRAMVEISYSLANFKEQYTFPSVPTGLTLDILRWEYSSGGADSIKYFDSTPNGWMLRDFETLHYDASEKLTSKDYWESDQNTPGDFYRSTKTSFDYDSTGALSSLSTANISDIGEAEPYDSTHFVNNTQGLPYQTVMLYWRDTLWEFEYQTFRTYFPNGYIKKNTWQPWDVDHWGNSLNYQIFSYSFNPQSLPDTMHYMSFDSMDTDTTRFRWTYTYDSNWREIRSMSDYWDDSTQVWSTFNDVKYDYCSTGSTQAYSPILLKVNVYDSPDGGLVVSFANEDSKKAIIRIFTADGRILAEQVERDGQVIFPANMFLNGPYIVHAQVGSHAGACKWVKR